MLRVVPFSETYAGDGDSHGGYEDAKCFLQGARVYDGLIFESP